ncbi:L-type lectin-domain containing receptor kinase SIT2-like [Elaeis guineensis]|uniref:non-specific serine/threonine protein kinase n=1 Tax=Elaeis guineensis var. tenera TaxID=51953 RepID=A0A6I9R058_ELAGV|nr:L-type lectin-domain containing receptor kinase IV.1-like [Elaeis guineensis]
MFPKNMFFFLILTLTTASAQDDDFTYNGFGFAKLHLDGIAEIATNGLLILTDNTRLQAKGHAFHPSPLCFRNSTTGKALSFSTSFIFAIVPKYQDLFGHGLAFVLAHSVNLSYALPSQYLGLFNTNNSDSSNQIVAIEFDTNMNPEFGDIDNNHVGIDVSSPKSINSSHAAYFTNDNGAGFKNLSLASGKPIQAWIEYSHMDGLLNVTLAPIDATKPGVPCLSSNVNLSSLISDHMYVGFSSSVGSFITSHYILGWSFKLNGRAQALDFSRLPSLPHTPSKSSLESWKIGLPIILAILFLLIIITGIIFLVKSKIKFREVFEDWELEYGPQRFCYKDLFLATMGFKDQQLLGAGGFGRVYKGVLPKTDIQVAVKQVSHESRQGMREFIAEIVSLGRLRHRNLVQLLGYCRRKGELLLVYEFMPNGSLDKFLFNQPKLMLSWGQRFQIIKGVASALYYLHEEWEKVVVHRDIKASNILLDDQMNGRLGDFGLARLYDHGTDPRTTHVVGTLGYLAPELTKTGKATTSTDVFAFGGFLLEVACGRRPIEIRPSEEDIVLANKVLECWKAGTILEARDPNLGIEYVVQEMEMVLKLGLLCSHPNSSSRPPMRLVMQIMEREAPLPEMSEDGWNAEISAMGNEGFSDVGMSNSSLSSMFACSNNGTALLTGR